MKKIFLFFIFVFVIFSCKSNVEPKVYDKTFSEIENAIKLIHYLINIRNFDEAQTILQKNIDLYPDNFELTLMNGWLLLQKNELSGAKEIFEKLHNTQSESFQNKKYNPMICIALARIARLNGEYQVAEEELKHAKTDGAFLSVYWTEVGFVNFEQNQYELGEKAFAKASIMDKTNMDAIFYKYICQLYLGKEIDEIKHNWETLTKMENVSTIYYLLHAKCLYDLKKMDLCKIILLEGLARFSNNLYLNNFYAYFLYEQYCQTKEMSCIIEALPYIEKCFSNSKRVEPEFIDTYVKILEINNSFTKIKDILSLYYLQFPNSPEIIYWLQKYGTN